MPEHVTTDPACQYHRPIRGLFARWRDRRARGRACLECRTVTIAAAIDDEPWRTFKPRQIL